MDLIRSLAITLVAIFASCATSLGIYVLWNSALVMFGINAITVYQSLVLGALLVSISTTGHFYSVYLEEI